MNVVNTLADRKDWQSKAEMSIARTSQEEVWEMTNRLMKIKMQNIKQIEWI
jgi:hypothetical protein